MTELEHCDDEIRRTDLLLRGDYPDVDGLLLAVGDWPTECRLQMAERGRTKIGYRGPIPKLSAIARAEGNPGKRRLNDSKPQSRAIVPKCPDHLDAQAKKEWKRLIRILRRMRLFKEADYLTLATLCQNWSTLVKALEKLTEMGIVYKNPSGKVHQSPLLSVVNQCVDTITKLSREFGLTAAARSRIVAQTEPEPEDDLMALLSMPRPSRDRPQ